MKLLLGRPYFFEVTDPASGRKEVAPFIHYIMDICGSSKLAVNGVMNIVNENDADRKRFTCEEHELISEMKQFMNSVDNTFELYTISDGLSKDYFKYCLNSIQIDPRRMDEFKLHDLSAHIYYLVGVGLKYMHSFERYTMSGYPLVFVNETGGRKSTKMLTTEDFEKQIEKVRSAKLTKFSFEFANQKILFNPHFLIFDGYQKRKVKEYYVIDVNPMEQSPRKKSYFAVPRAFIQRAITVNTPQRAYPFRNEDDAVNWAMNNLEDFPSGGFEIVKIHGERFVYEDSMNKPR